MKKNYKFLSSLALAGILSTSILGLPSHAATTTNTTKTEPIGVCSKIINGKNIVPFVLSNREDKVTIKDIKDSGKFNMALFKGSAIPSEDTVVCTGDYFTTTDGKDYTVVVYGDVDKDGSVTILDALEIQENRGNPNGHPLDEMQAIAANVVRADGSGVNILDALQLQEYRGKATETIIDKPHDPDTEEAEVYPYTVTVNDNGYINANNQTSSKIGIKLDKTYDEEKTLKIKILDSNGKEIKTLAKTDITVEKYTDYVEVAQSFASVTEDGKLTIEVYETVDNKDVLVGSIETELNTVIPKAAEVATERCGTDAAKMSFNKMGESDIVKMYYTIVKDGNAAPTWNADENEFENVRTQTKTISNSKLNNEFITDDTTKLVTNETYTVYYILENSYGSKSGNTVSILSDTVSMENQIKAVEDITVADLSDLNEPEKDFSWKTVKDATGYSVTVYKDGNIIAESTTVTVAGDKVSYDITGDITSDLGGAGKYKINVIAKGDATHPDSTAKMSAEIEVKALNEVTPTFAMNDNSKPEISWEDTNKKDDVASYTVKLYKQDTDGTYPKNPTTTYTGITEKKKDLSSNWESNKVYKAEVIAVAKNDQMLFVDSTATLEGFYEIRPNLTVSKVTENSVILKLTTDVKINGQTPSYTVNTYEVRVGDDKREPEYQNETSRTPREEKDEDGNRLLIVDGLESNKKYAFKLIADINGAIGESVYVEGTTLNKTPTVKDLTVVKTEKEAVAGTIYKNGDTVIINGEKIDDITDNYSEEFQQMMDVIDTLNAKDVVTLEGNTVELTLPSEASQAGTSIKFDDSVKDKKIIINGVSYEKIIETDPANKPAEVVLQGNGARFNTTSISADKITLTSGVIVNGNKEYTVTADASNVIINGIKVATQQKTVIKGTAAKAISVVANDKEENTLTFENAMDTNSVATAGEDAVITFVSGKIGTGSQQLGTVNIKTEGGSITVKQNDVEVASTLNVEVNSGDVTIGGDVNDKTEAFTGNQNITVTNKKDSTTTVKTLSKAVVPEKLVGVSALAIKEYTKDNRSELEAKTGTLEDKEFVAIQSYLGNYSDLYEKATISFTASATTGSEEVIVEFEITGEVSNMNLPNVK